MDEVLDCPFCGNRIVWADALIFGCAGCGAEFEEEDIVEPTFTPWEAEENEED